MKKLFTYFGILLSAVLLAGAVTACNPREIEDSAEGGLGIKTFFPTKVVPGTPMTINGNGLSGVTEIVFPDGITVTDFEKVGGEMLRVTVPSGISSAGGKLIVRTTDDQVESLADLTLGKTIVSGFDRQEGETVKGGEQITVYGTDLEFINRFEVLDENGDPLILTDNQFYRKGTGTVVLLVPRRVFKGTFTGKLYTYDGQEILLPELTYEPAAGEGYWEMVEHTIWEGSFRADWGEGLGIPYTLFTAIDGFGVGDTVRVYVTFDDEEGQLQFLTGSWNNDQEFPDLNLEDGKTITPDKLKDGYFEVEVTDNNYPFFTKGDIWGGNNAIMFQGNNKYTLTKISVLHNTWNEGGGGGEEGHWETQERILWDTETVFADWSATILIGPEHFADAQEGGIIRVNIKDKGGDYNPIFKHEDWSDWAEFQSQKVDGEGYFEAPIPAEALDELRTKGLRFQGVGFTITQVTLIQETWIDGDAGHWEHQENTLWDTETVFADWSATILIGPEHFADAQEGGIIRVNIKDKGGDYNPIFKHEDWSDWAEFQSQKVDGEGYFEAPIPAEALDELRTKGLRFQGVGFTITQVTLIQDVWIEGGGGGGGNEPSEKVLWDTETAFPDWSATILIGPGMFADAQVGNIVRVDIKDKGEDYNPIFKHENWSDWAEFQSQKADGDGYFEAPIPDGALEELQTTGLRFQGIGFTIVKVTLIP